MAIKDVLVGEKTILVKREKEDIELKKHGENTINSSTDHLPEPVVNRLQSDGFSFVSPFPMELDVYVHDEATRGDKRDIADQIGLDEETEIVREIANIGYEIPITVHISDESTWEVTKVFGKKLEEPYSLR